MTENSIRFGYLEVIYTFENNFMEVLHVQTRLVWFEEWMEISTASSLEN